ncbi:hypothetical protein ACFXHA_36380 [Nocardia sp. NPDC059240]|uniref:hypothetical protein n=1 Tax=Nocardia sp. NPDC059240 TaxID=3346786 RepID=UPI00367F2B08
MVAASRPTHPDRSGQRNQPIDTSSNSRRAVTRPKFDAVDIVTESAPYTVPCIDCGSPTQSTLTEALVGEDHRWDIDGQCSACGAIWADCGYQQPHPDFREAILAANRTTVLELGSVDVPAATLMRALRLTRSLSLTAAKALAADLRTTGLKGTRVEMELIARQLHAMGVHTRKSK